MKRYQVRMRYVSDDFAIVDASSRAKAIERAFVAVSAPTAEEWVVDVWSDVVEHYNPVVKRLTTLATKA